MIICRKLGAALKSTSRWARAHSSVSALILNHYVSLLCLSSHPKSLATHTRARTHTHTHAYTLYDGSIKALLRLYYAGREAAVRATAPALIEP
jgi:hypothetical protein